MNPSSELNRVKQRKLAGWLGLFLAALLLIGYGLSRGPRVELGKTFTLQPGQRVRVSGTRLSLELKTVGHAWYADGSGEFAYAEVVATIDRKDTTYHFALGEPADVGGYTVKLVAADPFGDTDCDLLVEQSD